MGEELLSCSDHRRVVTCANCVLSPRRLMQPLLRLLYFVLLADIMGARVMARTVKKICTNEIDLMTDEGVFIENVEQSHVELPLAFPKPRSMIRLDFRTRSREGLLFYGISEGLLALRLRHGDLYYKIHCSSASVDVRIPHEHKLNDGNWHSIVVRFKRGKNKNRTQIEVDRVKYSKAYEVSCSQMTSLVFGGVRKQDKHKVNRIMGKMDHFKGCLRRVSVPFALSSPPKYYAISICEQ